jgi:DNA-binding transcriptional ArsR family regulator
MTTPLADRLLEALGDPTARATLRHLLTRPAKQAQIVTQLQQDDPMLRQSTVSRTLALLRALGAVDVAGGGGSREWSVRRRDELLAVLLAADRLADGLLEDERERQAERSGETHRLRVRPAQANDASPPAG